MSSTKCDDRVDLTSRRYTYHFFFHEEDDRNTRTQMKDFCNIRQFLKILIYQVHQHDARNELKNIGITTIFNHRDSISFQLIINETQDR